MDKDNFFSFLLLIFVGRMLIAWIKLELLNMDKYSTYSPMELIYEDEIDDLKKVIKIIDKKAIDIREVEGRDMKRYKITILRKDIDLFLNIMRKSPFNPYYIRRG